ncbi:uncharacterized protein LOC129605167 [Condylostylus longicornis]|uniref:uncharacterized protein LOC129605167 n=1 Tax=Condylostylus longicornis TaxID=2530218 RepID=UPI00244DCD71|nr:uncharacterized protein LOC129605167 [Condylostylus longicornis]
MVEKIKRKNKADHGDNFIPPDGGWGWIVCIASGITNTFMFPVFQFFGLIFREKFKENGITNQQVAIMINSQMGFAALSGFFYGPIFRTFTYRKVAIFGSIQLISGIYFLSLAESFALFLLTYVFYLAVGKELIITAKQMAFNTYFKVKRRKALSIVAGIPSLTNIAMPGFITYLMYLYTSSGTLLILCALAGNVLVASLTYQPVKWHVKRNTQTIENIESNQNNTVEKLNNIEIKEKIETNHLLNEGNEMKEISSSNINKNEQNSLESTKSVIKKCDEKSKTLEQSENLLKTETNCNIATECSDRKITWLHKIFDFFDMDLVKDIRFLNICFGLSCSMLVEQNFKILAPFFLKDFGYSDTEIAFALSIGQIPDLASKILIPHILECLKVKWKNRTLWIFCIAGMMIGEIIIAQNPSYYTIVVFMFVEGIFSGAKSIFTGMLIPDHVILKKMPAAFGINRFISGIFMIAMGFLIGWIRKISDYTMALLLLNFISLLSIGLWTIERYVFRSKSYVPHNSELFYFMIMMQICMFPIFQQFGLIFRDKLFGLGITNKEITSIVNTHFAVSSLSGFFNGYIFREFSYRGVALLASLGLISGIYFMIYVETFWMFMLIYALYLGIGKGFVISAKQVAFLTYFKKNRRRALSIIVTLPAIGQIVMPHLVAFLMFQYGIKGTLLIFCGIAMHSFAASLIYQPVQWHVKKKEVLERNTSAAVCIFCGLRNENQLRQINRKSSLDTYFLYDPDEKFCNCSEIKTLSLNSTAVSIKEETDINEIEKHGNDGKKLDKDYIKEKLTIREKIILLLDLDLFKDKTFINICLGITCTQFVEQNFTTLAPFFLSDFGYSYQQITIAMSVTRIPDLISRIITPYVVQNIKWENRTFWLICVMAMTVSEMLIARNPSYSWIVTLMFFGGIFRGAKMIFSGMLIPDHVPLKRMPAALGLNRMLGGIIMLSLGPIIGLIRDKSNFQMALVFLNFISMIPITLWSIEYYYKKTSKPAINTATQNDTTSNNNGAVERDERGPMLPKTTN